ncbi:hypothetical protein AN642_00990 [Epulopiscium sp. SCG-B10WGA-EpuloA2]|nr:hypothetical protein AN642_00990 [Epulopiscium sp. SCG-B10WGA-EpuloA2]
MVHNKKILKLAFAMTLSIGATIFAAENTITVETIVTVNPVAIEEQLIMREHIIEEPKTTSCKCCCMTDTDSKSSNGSFSSSAQPAKVDSTILHKVNDDFTISSDTKLTAQIKENNENMKLILIIENFSDFDIPMYSDIELHKLVNGDWYLMQDYKPGYPDFDISISPNTSHKEEVNLLNRFGILEDGTYRIIRPTNVLMNEYMIAEFTIE